jgi:RNA polymerase sigma-70 factor (ECF subfamily)
MTGAAAEAGQAGEAALLAELRHGSALAYAALMRRNNERLYRLARGILRDDGEAEEAVQEGYVRAFTHLDAFKGEASLATWLARIVLNEALARRRQRRPMVDIAELQESLTDAEQMPSPEQALARHELRRGLERAVDALPVAFRSVFMLRAVEQMSIAETAHALAIPPETVKTRLHRANKLLRQALARQFGEILEGAFPFLGARCDGLVARVLQRLGFPATGREGDRPSSSRSPP